MTDDRGTVLLEMVVLGFATLLLVLPALITIARIVEASAAVEGQARASATWTARHGRPPDGPASGGTGPRIDVELVVGEASVTATARSTLTLVSVGGLSIDRSVVAVFEAPISPYRSGS